MAVVMCGLEVLDAPAYIHCKHIGVCEFLDVVGVMGDSTQSQITSRDRECDLFLTHLSSLTDLSSPIGLSLSDSATSLSARKKRRYLDLRDYFSIRCQDQRQGVFAFWETLWIKTAIVSPSYASYAFALKDRKSHSQPLRIVEISVIKSWYINAVRLKPVTWEAVESPANLVWPGSSIQNKCLRWFGFE